MSKENQAVEFKESGVMIICAGSVVLPILMEAL
jgi:hypothetical protein